MNVPGSNLLRLAMGPIAAQTLGWQAWLSRTTNAAGDLVSTFADPVDIRGSFQPINKALYQSLGLDLEKSYFSLWTSANVMPTSRDRQGDVVSYLGVLYQVESDQDWRGPDGWRKLMCVEVPNL